MKFPRATRRGKLRSSSAAVLLPGPVLDCPGGSRSGVKRAGKTGRILAEIVARGVEQAWFSLGKSSDNFTVLISDLV